MELLKSTDTFGIIEIKFCPKLVLIQIKMYYLSQNIQYRVLWIKSIHTLQDIPVPLETQINFSD